MPVQVATVREQLAPLVHSGPAMKITNSDLSTPLNGRDQRPLIVLVDDDDDTHTCLGTGSHETSKRGNSRRERFKIGFV